MVCIEGCVEKILVVELDEYFKSWLLDLCLGVWVLL